MKQIRIIVSGRVQGVFFRSNTQKVAVKLGLKGFVRNLPDGRLEVVAQGSEDNLKELAAFCRAGPPGADVENVDVKYEELKERFNSFEVRY